MPRTKKPSSAKNKSTLSYNDYTISWPQLSVQERDSIIAWSDDVDLTVVDVFQSYVDKGWKISLSYLDNRSVYLLSLTCKSRDSVDHGKVVMYEHKQIDRLWHIAAWLWANRVGEDISIDPEESDADW